MLVRAVYQLATNDAAVIFLSCAIRDASHEYAKALRIMKGDRAGYESAMRRISGAGVANFTGGEGEEAVEDLTGYRRRIRIEKRTSYWQQGSSSTTRGGMRRGAKS